METTNPTTGEPCWHTTTEPVLVGGEFDTPVEVACVCTACLAELPAHYDCTRCAWVEERRMCELVPTRVLSRPCQEHTR